MIDLEGNGNACILRKSRYRFLGELDSHSKVRLNMTWLPEAGRSFVADICGDAEG
jgi:hypothetical protein